MCNQFVHYMKTFIPLPYKTPIKEIAYEVLKYLGTFMDYRFIHPQTLKSFKLFSQMLSSPSSPCSPFPVTQQTQCLLITTINTRAK